MASSSPPILFFSFIPAPLRARTSFSLRIQQQITCLSLDLTSDPTDPITTRDVTQHNNGKTCHCLFCITVYFVHNVLIIYYFLLITLGIDFFSGGPITLIISFDDNQLINCGLQTFLLKKIIVSLSTTKKTEQNDLRWTPPPSFSAIARSLIHFQSHPLSRTHMVPLGHTRARCKAAVLQM